MNYDGTPEHAGMGAVHLTGRIPSYSMYGFREMVVVAARYADDPDNRTKTQVEYDCRDIQTGDIYPACRKLEGMSGMSDGDDDVLHVAATLLDTSDGDLSRNTPAADTDGDYVLVGFVEGSYTRPVIIGVLRHGSAKYGAAKADGERRLLIHADTSREIKADGTYVIKRGSTTIMLQPDETVEVQHKSGSVLRFKDDGDIQVVPAGKLLAGAEVLTPQDGVVTGVGIDVFTGQTYYALGNASTRVLGRKL